MEIAEHIRAIQRDGDLLAAAAQRAGLDAPVPSCPPWQVRDLLRHVSYVHRWAAVFPGEGRLTPVTDRASEPEVLGGGPPDDELLDWFRAGHAALIETLRSADPDVQCWTFLSAPSPLAFWARRQAHETAMHRVDAELADTVLANTVLAGTVPTPFPADFAADGIDELIMGFFGRDSGELTEEQRAGGRQSLLVRATDTGGEWLLDLTEDGKLAASVRRGGGPAQVQPPQVQSAQVQSAQVQSAQCTLAARAPDLYLLLWNRVGLATAPVELSGDHGVFEAWQEGMRVTWQ
ncbi:MAG TPA: maleylpyruvate isomerase N-terminal domain-containing protein [Streptosporangiaceae bacterium]|jgi:uncharacterized protein (TIGR03083 family)|nr:maleylpyruvate isomerase N-terminal domain-containing protein [Streptosporangiaceae bacterium]